MSREIVDALCARFLLSSSFDVEPDEQERMVKWLVPEIERLLAQERERVRKQCAEHLDKVAELCGTAKYEGLLRLRYEAAAREIRQLDLTKLDEGGEEKGNG